MELLRIQRILLESESGGPRSSRNQEHDLNKSQVGRESPQVILTSPRTNILQIVDKRSAVMTAEGFLIGCEEAVIVNATHASLPRFGDNPDAMEFSNYIKALKSLIECASTEQSLENEEKCRAMIEEEVLAEVHQFYDADGREGSETIRLWSVNPTLHELFQHGPSSFLSKRSEEAKLPIPTGNSQMPEPSMAQSNFTPSGPGLTTGNLSEAGDTSAAGNQQIEESALQEPSSPATNNFPSTSDNSRGSYNIPDPRQYLFRWIRRCWGRTPFLFLAVS